MKLKQTEIFKGMGVTPDANVKQMVNNVAEATKSLSVILDLQKVNHGAGESNDVVGGNTYIVLSRLFSALDASGYIVKDIYPTFGPKKDVLLASAPDFEERQTIAHSL